VHSAATRIAEGLLDATRQAEPPIELGSIARLRCVTKTVYKSDIKTLGTLQRVNDGFLILLQRDLHWFARREFWAHEIAHTFFYDIDARPPKRLLSTKGREEEFICELLAREILIPRTQLSDALRGEDPSLASLIGLSKRFKTTISTMANRVIGDLRSWATILILCEQREHLFPYSRVVRRPGRLLRVVRCIAPNTKEAFVPINKIVEKTPIIAEAFAQRRYVEGWVEFDKFGSLHGEKWVQTLPTASGSGVIALIHLGWTFPSPSTAKPRQATSDLLPIRAPGNASFFPQEPSRKLS